MGIYTVRVPGTFDDEQEEKVTYDGLRRVSDPDAPGWTGSPSYTPDGGKLVFLQMRLAKYDFDQTQVMIKDLDTQKLVCSSWNVDVSFGDFCGSQRTHSSQRHNTEGVTGYCVLR